MDTLPVLVRPSALHNATPLSCCQLLQPFKHACVCIIRSLAADLSGNSKTHAPTLSLPPAITIQALSVQDPFSFLNKQLHFENLHKLDCPLKI